MSYVYDNSNIQTHGIIWNHSPRGGIKIDADGSISTDSYYGIFLSGGEYRLQIDGIVSAPNGVGVLLDHGNSDADNSIIKIGQTGNVMAYSGHAFELFQTSTVINKGSIVGDQGFVFDSYMGTFSINNSGTITASHDAFSFSSFGTHTIINSGDIRGNIDANISTISQEIIYNTGGILGDMHLGSGDDRISNSGTLGGVIDFGSGDDHFKNSATFSGDLYAGDGTDQIKNSQNFEGNIDAGANDDIILNTGTIWGSIFAGEGNDRLTNSGRIFLGVDFWNGNNTLHNSGEIDGVISFLEGNDHLINSGLVKAFVDTGYGNDVVKNTGTMNGLETAGGDDVVRNNGIIKGTIDLGDGDDKFYGGNGSETVVDREGADTYLLGGGNDWFAATLSGSSYGEPDIVRGGSNGYEPPQQHYYPFAAHAGGQGDVYDASNSYFAVNINLDSVAHNDTYYFGSFTQEANTATGDGIGIDRIYEFETVFGSSASDVLTGDRFANNLYSSGGNDYLNGGLGNDLLDGGDNNDILIGGKGADRLFGGAGDDHFCYTKTNESSVSVSGRDIIVDFDWTHDKIEFLGFRTNVQFQGIDVAFDGSEGSLVANTTATGWTLLVDINGDKHADMAIEIFDTSHSTYWYSGDFVMG